MCGFTGFVSLSSSLNANEAETTLKRMSDSIAHRGPDGEGAWLDWDHGLALGHRRLSILDLSEAGAQPMASHDDRYVIAFNGEIYNHLELRKEINTTRSPSWRGSSDTETLLAAIELWGIKTTLEKIHGMFAFALWDKAQKELTLARDRLGEKPLYYGFHDGAFLFGSELKALTAYSMKRFEVNPQAVASFIRYSYVPSPLSIYQGIKKLPPACYIKLGYDQINQDALERVEPKPYWSLQSVALQGAENPSRQSPEEITDHIEEVLTKAVNSQMLSDVPLGVFLSGGIDSSLITALMVNSSEQKVKSFSIGFEDAFFNEAAYAREVAKHLGTDHHEFVITEADALASIPKLSSAFDEPFADNSQIPTMILSEKTRQHVTVALSGDGGDEIFGGYNRYIFAPNLWEKFKYIPAPMRKMIGGASSFMQGQVIGRNSEGNVAGLLSRLGMPKSTFHRFSKFGNDIGHAKDFGGFFQNLISSWPNYTGISPNIETPLNLDFNNILPSLSLAERMMVFDSLTYMPDDIFVKVDRSSMFHSLETRAPFLDPNVIEAAWRVPIGQKISGKSGKNILKDILHRHVPPKLFDRPKQGFAIPIDEWLRGELKDWAGDHLSDSNLSIYPYIDAAKLRKVFDAHQAGNDNFGDQIWPFIMLMAWTETHMKSGASYG